MARKAVSRKRKAPASPGVGSDAQSPQVRAKRLGDSGDKAKAPGGVYSLEIRELGSKVCSEDGVILRGGQHACD